MITPQAGYMVDPSNPNGVVKLTDINPKTQYAYGAPTATVGGGGESGTDVAGGIHFPSIPTPQVPSTLTSSALKSASPITLPQTPTDTTNYSGMINGGGAVINANNSSLSQPPVGWDAVSYANFKTANPNLEPTAEDTLKMQQTGQTTSNPSSIPGVDWLKNYIANIGNPPSASDQYQTDYTASGIDAKQTDFNTKQQALLDAQAEYAGLNAKLQGISAEATAIPIQDQQNAEGRGITAGGLAPITAGELRMNALKAIPVQVATLVAQAKVAAAQGNATLSQSILQQAQDHLDKVFQIHQTDATNAYNYKKDLIDKAYAFADKQEQQQLDAQKTALATNQSNLADARNFAQGLSTTATSNGQGTIAAQLASLTPPDINSKTFTSDLASYNAKVGALQSQIGASPSNQKILQDISDAQKTGANTVPIINDDGSISNVPINVAPYYSTSSSGVGYIDASKLQGTASEKSAIVQQAQQSGLKVITNTNTANDLVNIKDANAKLDSIDTIISGIAQPNFLARALGGIGLTSLSALVQSNPQKAAAGALQSVGLDILKAVSGVQGFRGNASVIQQVTDHLPKITDTVDVVNQKISYIKTLISDRENALVGKPATVASTQTIVQPSQIPEGYYQASDGLLYQK